jgi:hypothetical protein
MAYGISGQVIDHVDSLDTVQQWYVPSPPPPGRIKVEADKKGLDVPKPKKRKMNDSLYSGLTSLQLRNTISTMVHGRFMISH